MALLLLALVAAAGVSCSQRHRPIEPIFWHLPAPICSRELIEAEVRFGPLDPERWAAIDLLEQAHLADYAGWRTRSIESLDRIGRGRPWPLLAEDPATLERMARRVRQALAELAALDEAHWQAIAEIVAGSAWSKIDPDLRGTDPISWLRTRRALERWLSIVEHGGGRPLDLRSWVEGTASSRVLPPQEERILAELEERSVPLLERLAIAEWSLPGRERALIAAEAATAVAIEGAVDDGGGAADRIDETTDSGGAMARVAAARTPVAEALGALLRLQLEGIAAIARERSPADAIRLESQVLEAILASSGGMVSASPSPPIERILAVLTGRGNDHGRPRSREIWTLLYTVDAIAESDPPEIAAPELERLRAEVRPLLGQRLGVLRRAVRAQMEASRPGSLAGGSESDRARQTAAEAEFAALRDLDRIAGETLQRTLDPSRLDEIARSLGEPPLATTASAPRPAAELRPIPPEPPLQTVERPSTTETGARSFLDFGDSYLWPWVGDRVVAFADLAVDGQAVVEQLLERDQSASNDLRRGWLERIQAFAESVGEQLQQMVDPDDDDADDPDRDARREAAIAEVWNRFSRELSRIVVAMRLEIEASELDRLEGWPAALGARWPPGLASLLRLGVVESRGTRAVDALDGSRYDLGGRSRSIAELVLALPISPTELAAAGDAARDAEERIRAAIDANERPALRLLLLTVPRPFDDRPFIDDPAGVAAAASAYTATQSELLRAQTDLLRSIEEIVPAAAPSLREADLAVRWPGIWGETTELRTLLLEIAEREDAARAEFRRWRREMADALEPALSDHGQRWVALAGAMRSAPILDRRLAIDPPLAIAVLQDRAALIAAARRSAEAFDTTAPDRAATLRDAILRLPAAGRGGSRIWE